MLAELKKILNIQSFLSFETVMHRDRMILEIENSTIKFLPRHYAIYF